MELKGSMGELKVGFENLNSSVNSVKTKVDDLVGWKHKIIGGAVVIGVAFSFAGFVLGKFSQYITINVPAARSDAPVPPTVPDKPAPAGSSQVQK